MLTNKNPTMIDEKNWTKMRHGTLFDAWKMNTKA